MMRRHDAVFVVLMTIAALGAGCSDGKPVGRICDLGMAQPPPNEVILASPSPDCESRTCLRQPPDRELPPGGTPQPANSGLCTAECSSDDNCDRVPESPCVTGFACRFPVSVGSYCCRRFCICKDYIATSDTLQVQLAELCDPANPQSNFSTCCNVPGRPPARASCP